MIDVRFELYFPINMCMWCFYVLSVICRYSKVMSVILMYWKDMHVDQELEASGLCMGMVETRRERYPNSLERSNWAQEGAKTEQKVLERYTKIGVVLPTH